MPRSRALAICLLFVVVLGPGCTPSGSAAQRVHRGIVVASFDFAESELLAQIYAGALRRAGYPASVASGVGSREIVDPALSRGLLDMVPEYAGSALVFFTLGAGPGDTRTRATHRALARAVGARGLRALAPAPAEDANAIVVTRATAARYDLRTVSDLRRVAPRLTFAGPPECPQRPLCLRGLRSVYGLSFRRFVPLDTGGPLTLQALVAREVDVVLLFTTDPAISADHLVELRDDRSLQPSENVTPVVRRAVLSRFGPGLTDVVDAVSGRLATAEVRALDGLVASGKTPAAAAADWLSAQGIG
jgi:osmoprotectant transport system substrate-binding protein